MKKIRIILATSFVFIAILFCLSCVRTNNEVSGLMTTSSMATQSSSSSSFVEPVEDTPQPIPATPTPTPLPELLYEGDFEFFLEDGEATITGYYGFSCNEVPSELGGCPVVHIGNDAFYYSDISCQTLPGTVKTIGDRAFSYCNRLIKMSLPGSVTSVGEEAFYQSNNIESITLSKSITYMGPRAFSNCSFSKVIIPEGLKFIGDEAFAYNNFDEKTMKRIEIPSTVEHIGFDAFKQVHEDYAIEVIIASQNKFYQMLNGNLMSKDGTVLYSGPYCAYSDEFDTDGSRFLGPYYVPDGVTRIEESAFTTTQATEFIIP